MSLRYQISVRILLISLCILLLGGSMNIWQARKAVNKEVDSSINLALQLIEISAGHTQTNKTDWIYRLSSLDQTRHLTIQLKKPSGQIINLTQHSKKTDKNNSPPAWFANLVVGQYPKVEYQINTFNNTVLTLIIQANPMDEIEEVWDESIAFISALLLLVLFTFISVHLVFNKTLLSIQSIIKHLKGIETGDYQNKLPVFAIQEYADIASAINHMTHVLDTTQQQNSALTQHSLQIQEEERQHLSQELHDEFGQSLTAIKAMAISLTHKESNTQQISSSISSVCDHLMTVVRSMMKQLHPLILTELGLKATLEDLVHHWEARNPPTLFDLYCNDNVDRLDQTITIQVFRVIQEGLTNIIRHANAHQVTISLSVKSTPDTFHLTMTDDGQGFDRNLAATGFGLLGMEERIKSLGGLFKLNTQPTKGTEINVQIPLS